MGMDEMTTYTLVHINSHLHYLGVSDTSGLSGELELLKGIICQAFWV